MKIVEKKGQNGGSMEELNKFKQLLNGGGITEDNISDDLVLIGGNVSSTFKGHGFTFI